MLRWKTTPAICAMMLTACPLTSFAQQIVRPAPPEVTLLQPMGPIKLPGEVRKVAYAPLVPLVKPQQGGVEYPILELPPEATGVRTAALTPLTQMPPIHLRNNPVVASQASSSTYRSPTYRSPTGQGQQTVDRAASPKVIIRSPFVQPHNPNLYLFVVENVGSVDATNASVDLYVPQNVTIRNVVPASASNSAQRAHVSLTNLKAGSKAIIEVEVSPTSSTVEFQTRLSLESVHMFSATGTPNYVVTSQPKAPVATPGSIPIASQLNVALAPPTEVVSAIPLEPLVIPKHSVPARQVSQVKSHLSPLKPIAATPTTAATETVATPGVAEAVANPAASTTARSGSAQPPNVVNAARNSANNVQGRLASAQAVAAQVSADAKLSATVDGPVTLDANQEANFSISVTNPNETEASAIIVQLSVPAGLVVTVLDRDAWFDEENQTISWEIDQLASGQQETIQYKAVGHAVGQKNQKVTIGMQNVYQGKAQLVTLISN